MNTISRQFNCYLAGPITGFSYQDVTGWREKAVRMLGKLGISAYSPMRGKEQLAGFAEIGHSDDNQTEGIPVNARGVMVRDHFDCTRADVVIAYLPKCEWPSLGTVMEVAWAYDRKIPLVAVTPIDSCYCKHPMLSEAMDYRVDTIEQAVTLAASLLQP